MAGKRKSIKKGLKKPDEFISFWERTFRFISRHHRRIITGAVVVVVMLSGFFIFLKQEEKKEKEADQLFGKALQRYQVMESPFREASRADYKSVLETFHELTAKFSGTSAGRLSLLYKGDIHLKLGEFDQAMEAYETFLKKAPKERLYRLLAMEGLGYVHEGKGEYEKAVEIYQRMVEVGEGLEVANAHLGMGRCYEKLGKPKEALESYEVFLRLAPRSAMANLVIKRISDLRE